MAKTLLILASLLWISASAADGDSWLGSIPHAISEEQVFKVVVLEIDGTPVEPAVQYPIAAGTHVFTVQLMLDVEWSPDLRDQETMSYVQDYRLNIRPGTRYQLAAKVDVSAPVESQLDGSFWSVFVYDESDF